MSFRLTSPEPRAYRFNTVHFTSARIHYPTPKALYADLHEEFRFTLDPCPLHGIEGLTRSWKKERVYCNPPYGSGISRWLAKHVEADLAVYLLPSRTSTRWWHTYAQQATEVRFLRGKLKFEGMQSDAPFPSVLLIFRNHVCSTGSR